MVVYLDSDFKCHVTDDGTMTAVETDYFDGKCDAYMEGYRFVPSGAVWTREDGAVFHGEMITPWNDWLDLDEAQRDYEREMLTAFEEENATLLTDMAQMVDEVYASDMEMMGL